MIDATNGRKNNLYQNHIEVGNELMNEYQEKLLKLVQIQNKIKHIHPIFKDSYPVTVVCNDVFEIYDFVPDKDRYELFKTEPCLFPVPKGIRAAFPLECYDKKVCAVVSGDAFDSLDGYVATLHEFVHCAQANECEAQLKDGLTIFRKYLKKNDYMWELNHPFPYSDPAFVELFMRYFGALETSDYLKVTSLRQQLKAVLSATDLEYLLWQEWKEGLARFVENKVNRYLNLEENHYGLHVPFSRVSFYESGSLLISLLEDNGICDTNDIEGLFYKMKEQVFLPE